MLKKNVLNRLYLTQYLFYSYPRSSRTEFSNKRTASDWLINLFNSDNSNIAYTKKQHCQVLIIITYMILKIKFHD